MKLGNITRIKAGKLDANAAREGGIYPFFTCARIPLKIDRYAYDCECVLVAGNGDLNVKYYSGKFEAYQRTYIIESLDKTKLSTKYLFYFLSYYIHILRAQTTGGVIKFIKLGNLTEAPLSLPILETQKKIVAELDNIEEGIRVKETQLKALDELIQSRFTEMFEHIKTKDKISNLCLVNPAKPKNIDDNLLVSFLPMANVSEQGNADLSVIRKYQEVKKGFTYFQDDDILFAKITPCMENGKGALVKNLKNNIGFGSTEFHVIRVQKALIPQYLFTITQSKSFRSLAKANMTGSVGQQRVPASFIENFSIPVPPFPLQNKFAQFVQQVEKAKEIVKIQIKDLQELLALKMDEYFK